MATKLNDVQIAQREFDAAVQAKRVILVNSSGGEGVVVTDITGTVSLPTGASTSAEQVAGNASLAVIESNTRRLSPVQRARNDYTATSVTTASWVELIASLSADAHEIEIFDSSGRTLELATGAAASEAPFMYVFPGGNGKVPVSLIAGARLSIRAVSANATAGEIAINLYG